MTTARRPWTVFVALAAVTLALRYEKDLYRTTNYRRGLLLPVNSAVEVVGMPSRASNEWKYWSSRFTTFMVRFEDDVVVEKIGR